MLNAERILKSFDDNGISFFTGVPDSQLKALCNCLMNTYGISDKHVIAANEGNAVGLAAGYHMATGKIPCVYLQNSGIGNIVNPVASLLNERVYQIPALFVVGWRGEDLGMEIGILDKETTLETFDAMLKRFLKVLNRGGCAAFVVKKGALEYSRKVRYENQAWILREEAIRQVAEAAGEDVIVSTTGKASRELFEIREANRQPHQYDFLTVGSMGHSSMIALGVALNQPERKVWCIDGDGAVLMHMGALAVIGAKKPRNLIHVVMNNGAHETVGGMPTVCGEIRLTEIARACGYPAVYSVDRLEELGPVLEQAKGRDGLAFVEVKTAIGSREDLGRPTTTAVENKQGFMAYLKG